MYIRNAETLSRAFGSRVLYRSQPGKEGTIFEGTSVGVTEERAVPSVTVELGGGLIDQRPYVARGLKGLSNIFATLEMLDSDPEETAEATVVDAITTLRPKIGGFLETEAPALGRPSPPAQPWDASSTHRPSKSWSTSKTRSPMAS